MELFGLLGGLCIDLKKSYNVAFHLPENKQAFLIAGLFWIVPLVECLLHLTLVHLLAVLVSTFIIETKWVTWNSFDLSVQPDVVVIMIIVIIIVIIIVNCYFWRSPTLGL